MQSRREELIRHLSNIVRMNMKRPFSALLSDYLEGTLPAAELAAFFEQIPANRDLLANAIDERAAMDQPLPENKDRAERMLQRLEAALDKMEEPAVPMAGKGSITEVPRIPLFRRLSWVAAAVLILVSGTYLCIAVYKRSHSAAGMVTKTMDIAPGHNGAVLTLSNGSQVLLDSLKNGIIAQQSGSKVLLQDGQLNYDPTAEKPTEMVYNTMTTPKGRQFQLVLPDGTKVWLNAASSIRYPTAFTNEERKVNVSGEAYFEVAKNTKMPFRVDVDGREEIEVLGTHFNVNAYENEKTLNTTLLEGRIKVRAGAEATLRPGQQAQIRQTLTIVNDTDLDKVMAWKNGAFNFEDLSLEEAMRQLERWYDIKVTYESGVPDVRFGGKIGRDVSLADLLLILAGTKLKFRIEKGRELIIMK